MCIWGLQSGSSRTDLDAPVSRITNISERLHTDDCGHIACDSLRGNVGRCVSEVHLFCRYATQNECVVQIVSIAEVGQGVKETGSFIVTSSADIMISDGSDRNDVNEETHDEVVLSNVPKVVQSCVAQTGLRGSRKEKFGLPVSIFRYVFCGGVPTWSSA